MIEICLHRLLLALAHRLCAGRTFEDLAAEFEPLSQTIRNWIRQARIDSGW